MKGLSIGTYKVTLESNIENIHIETVDGDIGNMAVERYLIMDVVVEMTLKYGCIKRPGKCGCRRKYLSTTFF